METFYKVILLLFTILFSFSFITCEKNTDRRKITDSELFFRQTIDNDISKISDLNGWSTPIHPWSQDPIVKMWITFRTDSIVKLKQADKYLPADEEKEKFISWFIKFAYENGFKNDIENLDSLKYISLKKFDRKENNTVGKYFYFYNSKTKKHYLYYEN